MSNTAVRSHYAVHALCEGALMVACATVLSYLKLFELPQGGSICIGMLPILLYAVRWGVGQGLLAGFVYGLLQLILDGAYAWGWASMLLDYIVAFTALGLAGLFTRQKYGIFTGAVVGSLARFAVHFLSGITIYRIVMPTEIFNTTFTNPYVYSLVYNGSYVAADLILCLVIFALLYRPLRRYFLSEDL